MKPFDLKKAIAGKKVVTRDGHEVTEFYYLPTVTSRFSICAVINGEAYLFTVLGKLVIEGQSDLDLFMAPETMTLYYLEFVYDDLLPESLIFYSGNERLEFIETSRGDYKRVVTFEREVEL